VYFLVFKRTVNNLFCVVINIKGEVVVWASSGNSGFRGPARKTPYAAEQAGRNLAALLHVKAIKSIDGFILRDKIDRKIRDALKGFYLGGARIKRIILLPKVAHNGLRRRKKKRR
jgi:small subunit ribosomal protein S11